MIRKIVLLISLVSVLSALQPTSIVHADAIAQPKSKPPSQSAVVRMYMQKLVAAKTNTEGYVGLAKEHFKEDSPEYLQAEKLYIAAQSCQAGWLAKLTEAIRQGTLNDLASDHDFAQTGDDCQSATKTFVDFVDANTAPSKGSLSWIGDAIDAAVKLWKAIKGDIQDNRDGLAKRLEDHATWQSWSSVGKATAPSKSDGKKTKPTANDKS